MESPERELLRSQPDLQNSKSPHYVRGVPPPAPLVFTPPKSLTLSCVNCDTEMTPDHQCKLVEPTKGAVEESAPEEGAAVGKSENDAERKHRMRWMKRLETRTDDLALKSRLIESLQDAYRTPESVLSNEDLDAVKDRFLEGALSPAQFLDELQSLPLNK